MIGNFRSGSKIFKLDYDSIIAKLDVQVDNNYDKITELNSMTLESRCDSFDYSGNKTFLINNLFLKI